MPTVTPEDDRSGVRPAKGMASLQTLLHLRATTSRVHARLHQHPGLSRLAAGDLTAEGYRLVLARLFGFHATLEAVLLSASVQDTALQELWAPRVGALIDDLRYLGLDAAGIEATPRMDVRSLAPLDGTPSVLGCLYVREGSFIGGRAMARALDGTLGHRSLEGRHFLAGTSLCTVRWHRLRDVLEIAATPGTIAQITDSAVATFTAFEQWMDGGTATGS